MTSAEIGLVDSDIVEQSVFARIPAAPNNPFSSPLKDGILGPSPDCASEEGRRKQKLQSKVMTVVRQSSSSRSQDKMFFFSLHINVFVAKLV